MDQAEKGQATDVPDPLAPCQVKDRRPSQERDAYLQAIQAIQRYIEAGDTYQVNYT